ncbi:AraC family ligand binding domain-containing protein, partial [Gordonibacter urolithinfaciens]
MDAREVRALARPDGSIVEVCSLAGNIRAFPNHLHDHYVVGALYASRRALTISARELHVLEPGDVFLVNPGDPHACDPLDDEPFAYRCANVPVAAMAALAGPDGGPADVPERARAAG